MWPRYYPSGDAVPADLHAVEFHRGNTPKKIVHGVELDEYGGGGKTAVEHFDEAGRLRRQVFFDYSGGGELVEVRFHYDGFRVSRSVVESLHE